jgi:hypothetical protein
VLEIGTNGSYDFTAPKCSRPKITTDGIPDGDNLIVFGQPHGQSNSGVCGIYKKLAAEYCSRPAYQLNSDGPRFFLFHCNGQWVIADQLSMSGNGIVWRCFSQVQTPDQAVATGAVWETGVGGGGVQAVPSFSVRVQTAEDRHAVTSRDNKIRERARALGAMRFVGYTHGPNATRLQGVFDLTDRPLIDGRPVYLNRATKDYVYYRVTPLHAQSS